MRAEPLLSLAASVAGEHRTNDALRSIVRGLAEQPGVALARIWLLAPGDICDSCFLSAKCATRTQCLHLAASAGSPRHSDGEDWAFLQGHFRRIPLKQGKVGHIGDSGESILVGDFAPESNWFMRPEWARREQIRSFAGHALVHRGKILGVLGIFNREVISQEDFGWMKMFADQAAVAIANARAFEELVKAEAAVREREEQLQQIIDAVPLHMFILYTDGSPGRPNRASRAYFEPYDPVAPRDFLAKFAHPDDVEGMWEKWTEAQRTGRPFHLESRFRGRDGEYHWFLEQFVPLHDADGRVVRWCGVRTDIDEQKRARERMERENLVLREEVDNASMFEEIVGGSPALKPVLARVAKVAPSDSTVLITGETGTGKELIARAIHKRSQRAARAFVSVSCAAIPRDLIASELFGHEKGAFTGALQRRLGRFELAECGTIFLDEIGELPAETQVTLLRVLQEREFQRVGGNQSIRADVRVIAATHRDLPAAIEAGTFRSDLYYRINVFPIEVPPLRERREDIRLLVEYFLDRYCSKAGKSIRKLDRRSLERLRSYPWPGNIRELQNVIERSVILCESDEFSVDESWLSHQDGATRSLQTEMGMQEKQAIEAALAECGGRVSGPSGAAAKLGMPASTLDSKIKALGINKGRFVQGAG